MAFYDCTGKNCKVGTFTRNTSSASTVTLGFKPKYLAIFFQGSSGSASSTANGAGRYIYSAEYSSTYFYYAYKDSSGNAILTQADATSGGNTLTITGDGFTMTKASNAIYAGTWEYFAAQ